MLFLWNPTVGKLVEVLVCSIPEIFVSDKIIFKIYF